MPLLEGTRICHLRTNMGLDWADNVVPVLPDLGALPTDIVVRCHEALSLQDSPGNSLPSIGRRTFASPLSLAPSSMLINFTLSMQS